MVLTARVLQCLDYLANLLVASSALKSALSDIITCVFCGSPSRMSGADDHPASQQTLRLFSTVHDVYSKVNIYALDAQMSLQN